MNIADVFSIIGIGIIAAAIALVLRQHRPEFAMLVSIAAGVFILVKVVMALGPVLGQIESIVSGASIPSGYIQVLFKALGICFLTQIASETCKDAGESAISSKVEMAGKVAVLVVSLPLFEQLLSVASSLIGTH